MQEAAQVVGVSKKSLDDYYCQLRLGEHYGFDFEGMIHKKMRVLRNYVRECRKGKGQGNKWRHEKHPTTLKILKYYDLNSHSIRHPEEDFTKNREPKPLINQKEVIENSICEMRIINESVLSPRFA